MEEINIKRLTDNQRRVLTALLKKHDHALKDLIIRARDSSSMNTVSDKLSTNLDFKKKVLYYRDSLKNACIKQGVYIPIIDEALECSMYELDNIVPGRPRNFVRQDLNMARCAFFYRVISDEVNVNFSFTSSEPDID